MKRIMLTLAAVAMMFAAVSCECNNSKKAEAPVEEKTEECCEAAKPECCTEGAECCTEGAECCETEKAECCTEAAAE